jgi:hypothetical protein
MNGRIHICEECFILYMMLRVMGKGLRAARCRCRGPSLAHHENRERVEVGLSGSLLPLPWPLNDALHDVRDSRSGAAPLHGFGRTCIDSVPIGCCERVLATGIRGTRTQRGNITCTSAKTWHVRAWLVVIFGASALNAPSARVRPCGDL